MKISPYTCPYFSLLLLLLTYQNFVNKLAGLYDNNLLDFPLLLNTSH